MLVDEFFYFTCANAFNIYIGGKTFAKLPMDASQQVPRRSFTAIKCNMLLHVTHGIAIGGLQIETTQIPAHKSPKVFIRKFYLSKVLANNWRPVPERFKRKTRATKNFLSEVWRQPTYVTLFLPNKTTLKDTTLSEIWLKNWVWSFLPFSWKTQGDAVS